MAGRVPVSHTEVICFFCLERVNARHCRAMNDMTIIRYGAKLPSCDNPPLDVLTHVSVTRRHARSITSGFRNFPDGAQRAC